MRVVKYAFGSACDCLLKVPANNVELSVAVSWTARRDYRTDDWVCVVFERESVRGKSIFRVADLEFDDAWLEVRWGYALDLRLGYELARHIILSERTRDVFLFKRRAPEVDDRASLDWANQRTNINNIWWVEEGENLIFVGVVLVVDGQLHSNRGELQMVWWRQALSFSLADHLSRSLSQLAKRAECVILIVDICVPVEGLEGLATDNYLLVSVHRAVVWLNLEHGLHVVVPIRMLFEGVLLPVQRD